MKDQPAYSYLVLQFIHIHDSGEKTGPDELTKQVLVF